MITENLSTLKIHKLTQAQYDRELEAGNIDESALYLTPEEEIVFPVDSVNGKTGTVSLSADDVGALPTSGGTMGGTLNMGSNNITYLADPTGAMQAANKRYVDNGLSGKADSEHEHAASDITSGTFGVARGGTGRATLTTNAILAGNTASAVKQIATVSGALYATAENGAAKFGTLPIAQGGTGATTAAAALTNLGITATVSELNKLDGVTATTTELNYVDGVTSKIQTQLNGKASATPTTTSVTLSNGYLQVFFAKIGKLVIATVLPKVAYTNKISEVYLTVPSGYVPASQAQFVFYSATANGEANITVNNDGKMYFRATNQASVEEFGRTVFWVTA